LKNLPPITYLDNASTTKVDDRVLAEMLPFFQEHFGNPSAVNQHAVKPKQAIEAARKSVAKLINATEDQIIFNSGSTEGINHVLKSSFFSAIQNKKNHLVVSSIEHKAVLEVSKYLESLGCDVTYVSAKSDGTIDLEQLRKSLTNKTFLVCDQPQKRKLIL
jgi:cysteine desulfurase